MGPNAPYGWEQPQDGRGVDASWICPGRGQRLFFCETGGWTGLGDLPVGFNFVAGAGSKCACAPPGFRGGNQTFAGESGAPVGGLEKSVTTAIAGYGLAGENYAGGLRLPLIRPVGATVLHYLLPRPDFSSSGSCRTPILAPRQGGSRWLSTPDKIDRTR